MGPLSVHKNRGPLVAALSAYSASSGPVYRGLEFTVGDFRGRMEEVHDELNAPDTGLTLIDCVYSNRWLVTVSRTKTSEECSAR